MDSVYVEGRLGFGLDIYCLLRSIVILQCYDPDNEKLRYDKTGGDFPWVTFFWTVM